MHRRRTADGFPRAQQLHRRGLRGIHRPRRHPGHPRGARPLPRLRRGPRRSRRIHPPRVSQRQARPHPGGGRDGSDFRADPALAARRPQPARRHARPPHHRGPRLSCWKPSPTSKRGSIFPRKTSIRKPASCCAPGSARCSPPSIPCSPPPIRAGSCAKACAP